MSSRHEMLPRMPQEDWKRQNAYLLSKLQPPLGTFRNDDLVPTLLETYDLVTFGDLPYGSMFSLWYREWPLAAVREYQLVAGARITPGMRVTYVTARAVDAAEPSPLTLPCPVGVTPRVATDRQIYDNGHLLLRRRGALVYVQSGQGRRPALFSEVPLRVVFATGGDGNWPPTIHTSRPLHFLLGDVRAATRLYYAAPEEAAAAPPPGTAESTLHIEDALAVTGLAADLIASRKPFRAVPGPGGGWNVTVDMATADWLEAHLTANLANTDGETAL